MINKEEMNENCNEDGKMHVNYNTNISANMYYNPNEYKNSREWKHVDHVESKNLEKSVDEGINSAKAYVRTGLIKKAYGILSCQMVITNIMCVIAMISPAYSKFQLNNLWLIWGCIMFFIVSIISLGYFKELARKVPLNYILLILFTLCEGYLVSFVCYSTNPKIVFMAASMACFITLALTLYACTTKKEFTVYGSIIFLLACDLLLITLFFLFTYNKLINILFSCFGVSIYSLYLIYDTQLLIANKQNSIDTEDYILCAIMLYLDIINIFLYVLDVLKSSSDQKNKNK